MTTTTGAYATDRERVLTETLVEARDQIIELRDYVESLVDTNVHVFGPPPLVDREAWDLYDALMQDAEDRGEGQLLTREGLLTFVAWRPSRSSDSAAER